jgi:transaldolase
MSGIPAGSKRSEETIMTGANGIAEAVLELVREEFSHRFGSGNGDARDDVEWRKFRDVGTKLWLDTGDVDEAAELWNAEFEALTTNNTLLNREVQKGIYDGLVGQAANRIREAAPGIDEQELILEIAFALNARHGLKLVERFDAMVSVELHTDLGNDVERTVAYGKRFHAICPERFYVKVPLTAAGYLAARRLTLEGIPINFTLGFSARQNHVAALVSNTHFVNIFMGRLNAYVVNNELGDGKNVGEKVTLATQRELRDLRATRGARTRLIGASMRDGSQIGSLAGVDVYTMPPKVAAQYRTSPLTEVTSRVNEDPEVQPADGIEFQDFNGTSLWDVPDSFRRCTDELLKKDLDEMTPTGLQEHFAEAGWGNLVPKWSAEEIATATADGKIPIHRKWRDRLRSGALGLDALMNLSAFCSFATDQRALDDRIRSLL